jgi:hypothetical protein
MLSDIIIAEGDTGTAIFFCAACDKRFRAHMSRVTTAGKQPICLACVDTANPIRAAVGLPLIPLDRTAYLPEEA